MTIQLRGCRYGSRKPGILSRWHCTLGRRQWGAPQHPSAAQHSGAAKLGHKILRSAPHQTSGVRADAVALSAGAGALLGGGTRGGGEQKGKGEPGQHRHGSVTATQQGENLKATDVMIS